MKKLLVFALLLAFGATGFAQNKNSDKYTDNMRKAMVSLDSSWTDMAKMQETANMFERLANFKKDDWVPRYYHTLCLIQRSWAANTTDRPTILEAAKKSLDMAQALSPKNSEIVALEGYYYQAMIMINPMVNGQIYAPKSAMTLQRAAELDPSNPRPPYLLGQNIFFTPAQWGGGMANARPHLEKARELFEKYEPATEFSPNWGKVVCEMILDGKIKNE